MNELHFTDPAAQQLLQTLFKASRLIPFFGSGFTLGAQAQRGRVPNAKQLISHIVEAATSKPDLTQTEKNEITGISDLKTAFGLLDEYLTKKQAQSLLSSIFSQVHLSDSSKIELLRIDWPHIFTFNIDDAIENTTHSYQTIRPNRPTSREFIAAHKCLFKIHGDISEYAAHDDSNLIFTWREYGHSIDNNKAVLSYLSEEAKNSAFLFIGCSLDAEMDLIHLTKKTPFEKSIYIKKGKSTVSDRLTLKSYGISTIIYVDSYDDIANWLNSILNKVSREAPIRGINFDDSPLEQKEAIKILSSGGPLYQIKDKTRVARSSSTFPTRSAVATAREILQKKPFLLITGRRFSGKTLCAFQLAQTHKEYGVTFWGSSDSYNPSALRELEKLESHLFIFDSNSLDFESLHEVINAKIHHSSRIVLCASFGDAESIRNILTRKRVEFAELKLASTLDKTECSTFNNNLSKSGLPLFRADENMLTYAFRCYEEFKSELGESTLFEKRFSEETHQILILIAAFAKASEEHIKTLTEHFDAQGFVEKNDRIFELEPMINGNKAIVCNAPAWLLKIVKNFVDTAPNSYKVFGKIIRSLKEAGFSKMAQDLIRFDKLNELSGSRGAGVFIRNLYAELESTYGPESHYWLQRAKAELISAKTTEEISNGIRYAKKVRLDNADKKNSTYYSGTLVLTQLLARGHYLTKEDKFLTEMIGPCFESIENYQNNKRYIDDFTDVHVVRNALKAMQKSPSIDLLPHREKIKSLMAFFEI